jgi:fumarate reductase subunit D
MPLSKSGLIFYVAYSILTGTTCIPWLLIHAGHFYLYHMIMTGILLIASLRFPIGHVPDRQGSNERTFLYLDSFLSPSRICAVIPTAVLPCLIVILTDPIVTFLVDPSTSNF